MNDEKRVQNDLDGFLCTILAQMSNIHGRRMLHHRDEKSPHVTCKHFSGDVFPFATLADHHFLIELNHRHDDLLKDVSLELFILQAVTVALHPFKTSAHDIAVNLSGPVLDL